MMNNRGHLPAGQPIQGGMDMGPALGHSPQSIGSGGARRGRPHQQYQPHHSPYQGHHQTIGQHQPMYAHGYMPYAASPYYAPAPHQYHQNGGMIPSYIPYPPQQYSRSPPIPQQYMPMVPQAARPSHQSPVVGSPYQVAHPTGTIPIPPHTPTSTHSSALAGPPPIVSPIPSHVAESTTTQLSVEPQVPTEPQISSEVSQTAPQRKPTSVAFAGPTESYKPKILLPLPWLSNPDEPFPMRTKTRKRRRRAHGSGHLELPSQHPLNENAASIKADTITNSSVKSTGGATATRQPATENADLVTSGIEALSTQEQPSIAASTTSTTQASAPLVSGGTTTAHQKAPSRSAIPAVPAVPSMPKATSPKQAKTSTKREESSAGQASSASGSIEAKDSEVPKDVENEAPEAPTEAGEPGAGPSSAVPKPKLWAGLFSRASAAARAPGGAVAQPGTNGTAVNATGATPSSGGFSQSNTTSLAEAIQTYQVGTQEKLAFLEPRGLVNTGNMCYMNSVLQVLIFCIPFHGFLDQVSKKAAYSFKSDTPLIDAMIMFIREFNEIASAISVEQLQRRLKPEEFEKFGDPFIPEFVYDAIRRLPRFASMRRGHQQDAEEFLGFLLEGLHDECSQVLRMAPASTVSTEPNSLLPSPTSQSKDGEGDDWLEVGPKQKASVTRSSGWSNAASPITKIFGGQLRSEFKVPGLKVSVTLEPYQPLQLDIGAPQVRNIVDALKGLTRSETLFGDFNRSQGKEVRAHKQVTIESLPPVLILHLKRFQFDAEGNGTIKIWKKVGYPLELEIPAEVLSPQQRRVTQASGAGLPKYKLGAVVYHHGKSASGGHYTVDARRQDGHEWIRMDDTLIRRISSEEVAEAGAEEDAGKTNASQGDRKDNLSTGTNRFGAMNDDETGDEDGWKQAPANGKKWTNVLNGTGSTTPTNNGPRSKQIKDNIKDNKVAYLLFYERI